MGIIMQGALLICLALFISAGPNHGWKGIVPLRSSRQDAERILGPSQGVCKCEYRSGEDNVSIQYSGKPCAGAKDPGWKVPYDTVVNVSVYPKVKPRLSELKLDLTKYTKTANKEIDGVFTYSNENDGIMFEVDQDSVLGFYYTPTKNDEPLRCTLPMSAMETRK